MRGFAGDTVTAVVFLKITNTDGRRLDEEQWERKIEQVTRDLQDYSDRVHGFDGVAIAFESYDRNFPMKVSNA